MFVNVLMDSCSRNYSDVVSFVTVYDLWWDKTRFLLTSRVGYYIHWCSEPGKRSIYATVKLL